MYKYIKLEDRRFKVIRVCKDELTSQETRDFIKNNNILIDIVLRDGTGNLLFCHEMKEAVFRDVEPQEESPLE